MPKALLLLLCVMLLAWPHPSGAAPVGELDLSAIDAYVARTMEEDRVPGVALAIVQGERIVHLRGYGQDGRGEAITAQSPFILGSMSKSFTALAIMQLVERGAIDLDAPAQRYLPEFRVADPAASAQITVRHLLNHTSGIPTRAPQARQPDATLQDQVAALGTVSLSAPPGAAHEYASPNYLVLGAIVERVSGQPFGDYLQESIFTPLAMRHSVADATRAGLAGVPVGHRYWFGVPLAADLPYEGDRVPTAAVVSSAEDLAHYLLVQLNGGRYGGASVLSPTGLAELQRPAAPGDGFSYAMGWRVGPVHGVSAIHHGGIVPHFRGKLVLLPEQRWGVAVLTNASTSLPLPIAPTSHRMADDIAAFVAGRPLPSRSYTQGLVYLGVSVAMGLVLLNQVVGLVRIGRWRAGLMARGRWRGWVEAGGELVWPVIALVGLPLLIGLAWNELARSTPDMALWLLISGVLSIVTGVIKATLLLATQGRGHKKTAPREGSR